MFTILIVSENCQASELWFNEMSRLRMESTTIEEMWELHIHESVPNQTLDDADLVFVDAYQGRNEPKQYRHSLLEICHQLRARTNKVILLHSPIRNESFAVEAYATGIDEYIFKPTSAPLLLAKLEAWQRWIRTYSLLS